MNEPIQDWMIRQLAKYPRQQVQIARETGLPQTTVNRIARGISSPTLVTAQPLIDWLKAAEMRQQADELQSRAREEKVAG